MPSEPDNPGAHILLRKLATILSADVAEFSRLMGEDEEQTLRTFRGHKQIFESLVAMHRGRVFNTAGDAILAEFGSAVEAVRCATDIQSALHTRNEKLPPSRQVRFRIGINLGDVMLQDQDLLGDGVNIAARLQTAAEPGGICISGSVHDQIRNKLSLSFHSHGEMTFKNIQHPVRTFSITEAEGLALHAPKPHKARSHGAKSVGGKRTWIAVAALTLLAAAGAARFLLHRHATGLTDKDTIVLDDFANTTGDSVFDGTLRQGLSAQLEQSPFLSLISDQRIAETLALMGRQKDAPLTQELGREVCQRTGSAATIEGSISSLGTQYVLGLKAVNCRGGDILAREQATAGGKEQVLNALGDAATKLRGKLGESLASVQKYDAPPRNVTTPSLEALRAYSLGFKAGDKGDFDSAVPFYQRAISLDPNFAMAWLQLGEVYFSLGESPRESIAKAYELRERTGEQEKLHISSDYEQMVTGNLEAARTALELWAQTYPRDAEAQDSLTVLYFQLGEFEKALKGAQEELRLDPGSGVAYYNLAFAYLETGRLDEAKSTAQKAQAHNFDGEVVHYLLYEADFLQHDAAGMQREAAGLTEDDWLSLEARTAAYGGEFAKARELTRRASDVAKGANKKELGAVYTNTFALDEALAGNMALAKQAAQAALALANSETVECNSAGALALAGDSAEATRLALDLARRFPQDTFLKSECLPLIHATTELGSGDAGKALDTLAVATAYEGAVWGLFPAYLRGNAYLGLKQSTAAAEEFQKILNHPGVVRNQLTGSLAHLGLGRAYALAGDSAKAKTAYQNFFGLWKKADSDIPILQQARTEYAKLQ